MGTLTNYGGIFGVGMGVLVPAPYRFGESEVIYARRCELFAEYNRLDRIEQKAGRPNSYQRRLINAPLTEYERLTWQVQDTYALVNSYDEAKKAVNELSR